MPECLNSANVLCCDILLFFIIVINGSVSLGPKYQVPRSNQFYACDTLDFDWNSTISDSKR